MSAKKQLQTKSLGNNQNLRWVRRHSNAIKRVWRWKKVTSNRKFKRLSWSTPRKRKFLVARAYYTWSSPSRRQDSSTQAKVWINRHSSDREFGWIRKRPKVVWSRKRWWRPKTRDFEVSIVWRNGKKLRCITKLGNRKSYRPTKRKFPKWWKLSQTNKQQKKRRRDKKIFGFRWLYRTRNAIEPRLTRRRKFYSRCKRALDFVTWKLNVSKNVLKKQTLHQRTSGKMFNQLTSMQQLGINPSLAVRRRQRLVILSNVRRYAGTGYSSKFINSSSHVNSLWSNNVDLSVSVQRYNQVKRYRHCTTNGMSGFDSSVGLGQTIISGMERNLVTWRKHAWLDKNRLSVLKREHYDVYLARISKR